MFNKLVLVSSIETEIAKCKRSVFADSTDEVNREFRYLSRYYPHIQFFKSKETLFRRERYWLFSEATEDSKFLPKIRQIFSAGIYDFIESIFLASGQTPRVNYTLSNQRDNKAGSREPRALSLADRVQTCFWMYLICLSVSFICVLMELGRRIFLNKRSFHYNCKIISKVDRFCQVLLDKIHLNSLFQGTILKLRVYVVIFLKMISHK